jgi:drug/metabolite transporter (DMT)-like permease
MIESFDLSTSAKINSGLTDSVRNISIPLTAIAFYLKYQEKISKWDMIGAIFYLASNTFVVMGAAKFLFKGDSDAKLVVLAFLMAVLAGMADTLSILNLRYIIKDVGFQIDQLNFDGNLIKSIILLPFFINRWVRGKLVLEPVILTNVACFLYIISFILLSYAVKYGKGSTVQAIDANKFLVHAALSFM